MSSRPSRAAIWIRSPPTEISIVRGPLGTYVFSPPGRRPPRLFLLIGLARGESSEASPPLAAAWSTASLGWISAAGLEGCPGAAGSPSTGVVAALDRELLRVLRRAFDLGAGGVSPAPSAAGAESADGGFGCSVGSFDAAAPATSFAG